MTAKDVFHDVLKVALEKEGWKITHDPLVLDGAEPELSIDLAAEKCSEVSQETRKIAVSVKSFVRATSVLKYQLALVKFLNDRDILKRREGYRNLYLAVPIQNYRRFLQEESLRNSLNEAQVRTIVFDPIQGKIDRWIE
ncbi:MAG: element excision factor XisH family protein [Geitlerinemataceae cyanobacterium]